MEMIIALATAAVGDASIYDVYGNASVDDVHGVPRPSFFH